MRFILPSLKGYKKEYIKDDVIAGIVVAALTVPVAMGYAEVAGLPPVYGLYASIFPVIGYALFCSSRQLIFGMDAAASAITGSMLATLGIAAKSDAALTLAPVLSLFAGLFLVIFSLFKLGKLASFISRPVMSGFVSGISVSIMLGQIPKVLELPSDGTDFFGNLKDIFTNLTDINFLAVLLGAATIVLVLLGKKFLPKVPAALVILVIGTAVTAYFNLDKLGITVTGSIPNGFPPIGIPNILAIDDLWTTVVGGLVVAVVVFSDSLLDSNSFAIQGDYKIDDNQELRAFGIANVFASLSGTSPASASVSRTAASAQFHGKTQVVSLVAAGLMILIVLFLADLMYYLPQPVLSGIIIAALIGIIDLKTFRELHRRGRSEWIIWIVSFFGVLVIGVLAGVLIGVIMSFIDVIMRLTSPPRAFLGVLDGKDGYFDMKFNKRAHQLSKDIVIYRFTAPLIFANISFFEKDILGMLKEKDKPKTIIIEGNGISYIDSTALEELEDIIAKLNKENVNLYFADLIHRTADYLSTNGPEEFIKSCHIRKTIDDVVKEVKSK